MCVWSSVHVTAIITFTRNFASRSRLGDFRSRCSINGCSECRNAMPRAVSSTIERRVWLQGTKATP